MNELEGRDVDLVPPRHDLPADDAFRDIAVGARQPRMGHRVKRPAMRAEETLSFRDRSCQRHGGRLHR